MSDSSECKSYGTKLIPYDALLSKLLKDRFLCDIIIRVNTTSMPVHRVILSASSRFFHDLFKNVETINQEYDLTNVFVDPDNLDQILIYIYEGYIKIDWSNVLTLLTMNEVLGISSLNNHCAQFLLSQLRPMNVFEIWHIAWKYNLQELANISLIVCQETMTDTLLVKHNIIMLSEEFLSYVLATEVMASSSPQSVVRILAWWTYARIFNNDEKIDKLLSLLDIYFSWKTLSEDEFEVLRGDISKCFDFDPQLPIGLQKSWSRTKYKTPNLANIDKKIDTLHIHQDWSILVAEDDTLTVGVYCNIKSKWFTMEAVYDPLKGIGFFNDFLVLRHSSNSLLLQNVQTMASRNLTASTFADDDSVQFIDTRNTTFFMHSNNIYSIDAVRRTVKNDIICIINRWDEQRNEWITILQLNPELSNDILSLSLSVETSNGENVYFFLTVGSSQKTGECTSVFTAFTGKFLTDFGGEDPFVSHRELKMFYVFCINMTDFSYRLIGKRRNEPTDLNACRKILLRDKIIFLLDADSTLELKFGYAYHKRNDCHISCLQLLLEGENCWRSLRLRFPFPDVRDISIRKKVHIGLNCSVTSCKNLLFVGVHWSPHVFQVFKYDISTLIVNSLPSIPLPATCRVSMQALLAYQPICDFLSKDARVADFLNFHFKDWSLLSWHGTLIHTKETANDQ